ncbi:hypothetical protein SDC9_128938 [bioreactor metagenome]|uniref:Uncharacterized protein n=1 Tax=bioreactor metagenome TaxID=1076179 RepID=A0A645CYA6_9ZZZZ
MQQTAPAQLDQDVADPEDDRGVHVVAAGVGDARVLRRVRHVLGVGQRERIHVAAQRDHARAGLPVVADDVAGEAGADGQHLGLQAERQQRLGDPLGRPALGMAELGVGVQVTTEGDHPLTDGRGRHRDGGTGIHLRRRG